MSLHDVHACSLAVLPIIMFSNTRDHLYYVPGKYTWVTGTCLLGSKQIFDSLVLLVNSKLKNFVAINTQPCLYNCKEVEMKATIKGLKCGCLGGGTCSVKDYCMLIVTRCKYKHSLGPRSSGGRANRGPGLMGEKKRAPGIHWNSTAAGYFWTQSSTLY